MAQPLAEPISPASPEPTAASASLLPVEATMVDTVAKFFRALGDPTRLRLLEFLLRDEHTVSERVADPRVADLVVLAHALAADNACALAECQRIVPATGD